MTAHTTEILLRYDPGDAIIMMLNLENGTNFTIEDFNISAPVAGTVKNTRVTLTAKRPAGENHEIHATGSIQFEYNRLNVAHHFEGIITGEEVTLPTSSQVLLDLITQIRGQKFVLDDIVLEDIGRHNSAAYKLRAKAESLRWIGEMTLRLGGTVDINTLYDLPADLGILANAQQYSLLNIASPFINATDWQSEITSVPLNLHAENGADLIPLFRQIIPYWSSPGYRVPLHKRTRFEPDSDDAPGWVNASDSVVTVSYDAHRMTAQFTDAGDLALHHDVSVIRGQLVEVTYRFGQLPTHGPFQLTWTNDVASWGQSVTCSHGSFYAAGLDTATWRLELALAGQSGDSVVLEEIAARSFPRHWAEPVSNVGISQVEASSDTTKLILSGSTLTAGSTTNSGTVSTIRTNLVLMPERSYLLEADVISYTDTSASIDVTVVRNDSTSISVTPLHTYAASALHRTAVAIVNVPAVASFTSLKLGFSSVDTGATSSVRNLRLSLLPLPYGQDLLGSGDLSNSNAFQYTVLNPADGSVEYREGYVTLTASVDSDITLQFLTRPLSTRERYTVTVETSNGPYLNLSNHRFGLTARHTQGALYELQPGGPILWNQSNTNRYLNPRRVQLEGRATSYGSDRRLTVELQSFYGASGVSVPEATTAAFQYASVTLDYAPWDIDYGVSQANLYGAYVASYTGSLPSAVSYVQPNLTAINALQIDPTHSTEYSHAQVALPYVPVDQIASPFLNLSRLARLSVATAEDVTYIRDIVKLLAAPATITSGNLPSIVSCDPTQSHPWVNTDQVAMKNLRGATVQYNGPVRPQDLVPATAGLDRVLVLFLSDTLCKGYRGQVRFYYSGESMT